jgi:hypothetical protein
MKNVLKRFAMLGFLCALLAVVVVSRPQPAYACVCLHWVGLDGPCDTQCKDGYTYCQTHQPNGYFNGTNGVKGPCRSGEFSTTSICDNFFGCLTCAQWSSDCGGGT